MFGTSILDQRSHSYLDIAGQHRPFATPAPHGFRPHRGTCTFTGFLRAEPSQLEYLLLGFILFRVFDIWKPVAGAPAGKTPRGVGIMADAGCGIYAAILLRVALHFGLLTLHIGWV